ncbi:retrovirus-related pol polyprotein from transposon TNT 1-94 [Tanacetum coccineum]
MSSIAKFDVEKFNGSNDFVLWRVKMRCLLIQHGWEAALDPFPKTMADTDKTAMLKTDVYKKAHSSLLLCLDNQVLREVNKEDSAVGVWLKLETLYMLKSLANKLYLKKKLFTFYMHSGKKLSKHIDEFNKLIGDLANINVDIDDEDQALMLLTSLPPSYNKFVETLLYGRESLTLEDVLSSLSSRELKKRTDAKDHGDGLYVRGRSDHRGNQGRGSLRSKLTGKGTYKLKCYICYSEDHLKKDYPKRNKKKSTGFVKKNVGQGSGMHSGGYDNGDLLMAGFKNLCKESRIARHLTVSGTPQQNGLAERMNRTLLNKVRCLLIQSSLPDSFWAEAIVTTTYLINRSPSTTMEKKTPMDLWLGHPDNYEILWRLDDFKPKIIISRKVVFNESLMYKDTLKGASAADSGKEVEFEVEVQGSKVEPTMNPCYTP